MPHGRFALQIPIAEVLDLIEDVVSRIFASWNQLDGWLRQVEALRQVA